MKFLNPLIGVLFANGCVVTAERIAVHTLSAFYGEQIPKRGPRDLEGDLEETKTQQDIIASSERTRSESLLEPNDIAMPSLLETERRIDLMQLAENINDDELAEYISRLEDNTIVSRLIDALMKMLGGGGGDGAATECRSHDDCESCMAAGCDSIELESVGTYIFSTVGLLDKEQLKQFLPKEITNNFVCGAYATYAKVAKKLFNTLVKLHIISIPDFTPMRINDCSVAQIIRTSSLLAPLMILVRSLVL